MFAQIDLISSTGHLADQMTCSTPAASAKPSCSSPKSSQSFSTSPVVQNALTPSTKARVDNLKSLNLSQAKDRNVFLAAVSELYDSVDQKDALARYFATLFKESEELANRFLNNEHLHKKKADQIRVVYRLTSDFLEEAFKNKISSFGQVEASSHAADSLKILADNIAIYFQFFDKTKDLNFNYEFSSRGLNDLNEKKLSKRSYEDNYTHEIIKAFSKNHVEFDFFAATFFKLDYCSTRVILEAGDKFKPKKVEQIDQLKTLPNTDSFLGRKRMSSFDKNESFVDFGCFGNEQEFAFPELSLKQNKFEIDRLSVMNDILDFF